MRLYFKRQEQPSIRSCFPSLTFFHTFFNIPGTPQNLFWEEFKGICCLTYCRTMFAFYAQSWTKGWRQIHKIKQNRFYYGMFYSWYFVNFYQKTSKFGFRVDGWVLAIKPKHFMDFLKISEVLSRSATRTFTFWW